MGITRLTQDLTNYMELASLVIDGPSLVYHVYANLIRNRNAGERPTAILPSYQETCLATESLITKLILQGVEMIERMETTRKQLEAYKALNTELPQYVERTALPSNNLWPKHGQAFSDARGMLPPLPFLVPAVMEALDSSNIKYNIQIVPEEADIACARIARESGTAILTNDSDLAVFDLGLTGIVIFLRTLAIEESKERQQTADSELKEAKLPNYRVTASCIRPATVACQLSLPSLSVLAYERHKDPGATLSVIRDRAKTNSRQQLGSRQYEDFTSQYHIPDDILGPKILNGLDPRPAEFVRQASMSAASPRIPQIYLPILHEDPSRDSSWAYGLEQRQLAYSLFYIFQHKQAPKSVIEHARKGPRIATAIVPILTSHKTLATSSTLLQTFTACLSTVCSVSACTARSIPSAQLASPCWWHALALNLVLQSKFSSNKSIFSHRAIDRLLETETPQASSQGFIPTWEDLHLLANAQAVLYSLRILKQIVNWTIEYSELDADSSMTEYDQEVETIKVYLNRMPPLANLFLNIQELRNRPEEERLEAAKLVKTALEDVGVAPNAGTREESTDGRKKRKTSNKPAKEEKPLAGNMFGVLSQDTDENGVDESD